MDPGPGRAVFEARSCRHGLRRSPARSPGRGRRRPRPAPRRRGRRPRRPARRPLPGSPRRLSATSTSTPPPALRARTVTLPSAGVWRIAFWIRLKRTRWTFSALALATSRPAGSSAARLTPRSAAGARIAATVSPISSPQLDLAHRPGDVAGLDPRELEEVVDQVAEHGDVGADLLQVTVAGLAGRHPVVDRLDQQPQRGERRAQVMRGGGDELAARLLDLAARALLHRQTDGERGGQRRAGGREDDEDDLVGAHPARARRPRRRRPGMRRSRSRRARFMAATCSRRPRPSR